MFPFIVLLTKEMSFLIINKSTCEVDLRIKHTVCLKSKVIPVLTWHLLNWETA